MKRTVLLVLVLSFFVQAGQSKRKTPEPIQPANNPPVISKFESSAAIVHTCENSACVPKERQSVNLRVAVQDSGNESLTYEYSTTGGEILGAGDSVSWKLGGQPFGDYAVTVKVTNSKGANTSASLKVAVKGCSTCRMTGPEPPCPLITISSSSDFTVPNETYRGELLDFHAIVQTDAHFQTRPDYVWTVTNGRLLKGQHTPWIKVETTGGAGQSVSVDLEVDGFDLSCQKKANQSVPIKE